jgi:DNA polymerase III subunit epsilon
LEFVALDVETANTSRDSICQIGFAVVRQGLVVAHRSVLVDPEQPFDNRTQRIHGLTSLAAHPCLSGIRSGRAGSGFAFQL